MKTRESVFVNELLLELKYCERCGGLWLRPVGSGEILCVKCAGQVSEPLTGPLGIAYPKLPEGPEEFPREVDDEEKHDFDACGELRFRYGVPGGAA